MMEITPELYLYKTIIELHVARIKRYKDIQAELHRRSGDYLVLIGYNMFSENSWGWIDRVEVVKTDRKYLLITKKEILMFNLPDENGDMDKSSLVIETLTS